MRILLYTLLPLLLSACGPRYATQYELVVPPSASGKQCANQCYLEHQNCIQHCNLSQNACEANRRYNAHIDYLHYGPRRTGFGVGLGPRYYERYYDCPWPGECQEHCEIDYRTCFTACGGEVIPHTQCVENCPENAPTPQQTLAPGR